MSSHSGIDMIPLAPIDMPQPSSSRPVILAVPERAVDPEVNSNTHRVSDLDGVPSQTTNPSAQAAATFIDGSDPLFSMYNETAADHDRKVAENWRSDADSAVVANGLFSVMLAVLLGRSYQDLTLNPQDVSAFYLSQIYQLSTSTQLPFKVSDPSTFSPASSSVRTSALWSLSLVISLTCTLMATLLRQWARRYLHITQEPRGKRNRARIRELVARGVEMEQLQRISSVLPGLFHLSVFLFLSGLIHSSHDSVVNLVILSIAFICIGLYCFASVIPLSSFGKILIFYTPLSSFAWFSWSRIVSFTYKLLYKSSIRLPFIADDTQHHLWELARAHLSWTLRDTAVNMKGLARKHSSSLEISVVSRVFNSLDGHEDMDQFLSAIPGFYNSGEVNKDSSVLEGLSDKILAPAIVSFMDRSLSSNLLAEPKKQQRITICLQAMDADPFLLQCTFGEILQDLNSSVFRSIDFVSFALEHLRSDDSDPWLKDFAQCIVAIAISRVQLKDGAWIDIAGRYLQHHHTQYRWETHNLRLCNLIYLIRRLKVSRLKCSDQFEVGGLWGNVLAEALKFEIMNTAYNLQLEFRNLLDELRFMATGGLQPSEMTQSNARLVLSSIHTAFVSHAGTTPSAITFSSPTAGQGPVLQWLTSSHNVQEVVRRADPWASPWERDPWAGDIVISPGLRSSFTYAPEQKQPPEQPHEKRSSPYSDLPPSSSQQTPFNVSEAAYAIEMLPSRPPETTYPQERDSDLDDIV